VYKRQLRGLLLLLPLRGVRRGQAGAMKEERQTWPIVVGGCFRSGTSLVRRVLDAHSRIHCGPEVKFLRDFHGDYFTDPLGHLRFTTTARSLVPDEVLFDVLGRAFIELHERAALAAGKARWADKAPENAVYLHAWERLLGDRWLYVHVVRNPLDTLASINEHPFPLSIPGSLDARVALYRRYVEAGCAAVRDRPRRACLVRYEELVMQPESALSKLMTWLGEALEPQQLQFNTVTHVRGLEDPKVVGTSSVHADSLGRWRAVLARDEARTIWAALGDLWSAMDEEGRYPRPRDLAAGD
jgi:hypothetical protein